MSDSVSSEEDAPLTLEERVELLMLAPLEDTILEEVANVLVRDGKAVALTFATWVIDRHPKSEFRETTAARSVAGRIGKLFEEQHPEEKNLLARNFAAIVLTRLGSGKRSFTPLL
ncbi:hypothetical protein HN604_01250 [archaeon]|nr:hypothetical protein [archaeon]MBT7660690.1 hypothetical protein [archaeon]